MPRSLLITLADGYTLRGTISVAGRPQAAAGFKGFEDLLAQLPAEPWELAWVDAPPRSLGLELLTPSWQSRQGHLCAAADAAYMLSLPLAAGGADEAWVAAADSALATLPDDLLAQCAALVREAGATSQLGLFAAELERRFDALSMPAAGEVAIGSFRPAKRDSAQPTRHDLAPDILEKLFTARGALATAFESYEERPQQQAMASAVAETLAAGGTLVVEAGTGVGKSLAYLLPLALHSARTGKLCLVSTNTLNLQQQLLDSDVPRLRRILDMLDLRITLLKGREHYLCLKRLQDTWLADTQPARARRQQALAGRYPALLFMLRALVQLSAQPDGELDSLPAPVGLSQLERNSLARGIDCGFHTCLGDKCEHKPTCHFFKTREAAVASHIVLTNHALVFSLFNPEAEESDTVVSRASVVVLDEAHNLESSITNQRTLLLGHEQPVELGNDLLALLENDTVRQRLRLSPDSVAETVRPRFQRLQAAVPTLPRWIGHGAEVAGQIARLLEQAAARGHLDLLAPVQLTPATATPAQEHVLGLLEKLAQRLLVSVQAYLGLASQLTSIFATEESSLYLEEPPWLMQLQALRMRLEESVMALDGWRPADPQAIAWFDADLSRGQAQWTYNTAPLHAGPIYQALASAKESTILCSATLTVAGGFDYLRQSLGFTPELTDAARWLHLDSPFDYARQSLLLIATDMDGPTGAGRDRYLEQLQRIVEGVCEVFNRGVLVLFNSYRDLNHIASQLDLPDPDRLLVQGQSGTRGELAERFRIEGDKVLLATRSFWEGFDVAGDALSCVVLAKLPFANFKDPIHAGRQRAIDSAGRSSFADYSLPLAAMQLKQGFGRLIRRQSDRGCVFLLDSRVATARYGQAFLDSLPNPRTFSGKAADCLAEARRFMDSEQ